MRGEEASVGVSQAMGIRPYGPYILANPLSCATILHRRQVSATAVYTVQ